MYPRAFQVEIMFRGSGSMPHRATEVADKDSELNSKFKIINSKSNNALAHAPLYYCIAFLARDYLIFLSKNLLNELIGRIRH